ncbi:ABC transporter permease subunit [Granulicatella sp. zg-ZJ]|uniref:ABC transporter permease subunit n=1 Tax=Granulicatella sp. zg-ZJ TaxID=2678504 RepID=UPI0013D157C2|nr:ABC transporter permease subunit [Granulicatella sp. zg-ZJ]NEW62603.1 ABC transporter permease subunit [Granulicatella sp. zg-ZJ]
MNRLRRLWIIPFLMFILAACTGNNTSNDTREEFRVGMEANYAPFNWTQSEAGEGTAPIEDGEYAGGYDVSIAQKIADKLNRKLVIVKLEWDGLIPSLQSGKIDAIIAGMSPTEERAQQIDFTGPYYESVFMMIVRKDGAYANTSSIDDFAGARVTAQLGTFHYDMIDQLKGAVKQEAMSDFSAMRVALESGKIDAYVSEKAVANEVVAASKDLKMIEFAFGKGFVTKPEEVQTAIGVKKGSPLKEQINTVLSEISTSERDELMDKASRGPSEQTTGHFLEEMGVIFQKYYPQLFAGMGVTLYISLIGTIVGLLIGLLIGVIRTVPLSDKKGAYRVFLKVVNWLLNAYVEIFRGTPMIVQAMVVYYGSALLFHLDMDKTFAALLIVSINTGAYMSEVVRGGILSIDKGQFEACQAIGMTHLQAMKYIVLPQVLRNILPATGNEFVINVKDTSVLNVIGVSELFFVTKSIAATNYQFFQTFLVTCIFYFIMTFVITRILRWLEKRLSGKQSYSLASGNQMQVSKAQEKE